LNQEKVKFICLLTDNVSVKSPIAVPTGPIRVQNPWTGGVGFERSGPL
jgi:hypothetical protein